MTPAMTYLGKSLASIDRSIDYIVIDSIANYFN